MKKAAFAALDACLVQVIQRFINWAWCFMSAYCVGLIGKAVAWAVRKQKGHQSVSQSAMMQLGCHHEPLLGLHNIPYVAKILLKNLANRTSCGKTTRGVFLDIFCYSKFKSAIRMVIFSADHKIL